MEVHLGDHKISFTGLTEHKVMWFIIPVCHRKIAGPKVGIMGF
jgi:hypothetical protein